MEGSEPGQLRAWPGPARWRWQVGSARTTFVSPRVQPPPGRTSEPRGKPPPPWHGTSGRHAKPRPPPRAAMSNDRNRHHPGTGKSARFAASTVRRGGLGVILTHPRTKQGRPRCHGRCDACTAPSHRPHQHARTGTNAPPAPRPHRPYAHAGQRNPTNQAQPNQSGATRPAANKPTHWHSQPTYRAR